MTQGPAANSLPQAILDISPTYDAKHFNKVVVGTQGGNNLANERKARRCLGKSDTQRQKKRDSKAQQAALDCYVSTLTLVYDGAIADLNCGSDDSFNRQVSSFSEEIWKTSMLPYDTILSTTLPVPSRRVYSTDLCFNCCLFPCGDSSVIAVVNNPQSSASPFVSCYPETSFRWNSLPLRNRKMQMCGWNAVILIGDWLHSKPQIWPINTS